MGFSESVANEVLVSCGRCCCICHTFCGPKIELHHIKQKANGGEDTIANCIPLCFNCHSDMGKTDPKHPKGKQYSEVELKKHRENWYKKVSDSAYVNSESIIHQSDRKLFSDICSMFSEDIRRRLSEGDLQGIHPCHTFDSFRKFVNDNKNPFNEFINADLEKMRGKLISLLNVFLGCLANNTFFEAICNNEYYVTNLWLMNHRDACNNRSDEERANLQIEFEKDANMLTDLSKEVWDTYCEFVRQGRRVLNE